MFCEDFRLSGEGTVVSTSKNCYLGDTQPLFEATLELIVTFGLRMKGGESAKKAGRGE